MPTVDLEVVADLTQIRVHSPEWHKARQSGFGGSDAAAAAGISKWKTPYQLWAEKVGAPRFEDEDNEPEYITWGKILEPVVRDRFMERTGVNVIPFPKMVRNTAYPWMLANVDGLTGPDLTQVEGVYEGKTSRHDWSAGGEVDVPLDYAVQGQHYLAVLGLDVVHYACLVGGQKMVVAQIERNDRIIDDLIAIEEALWQSVLNGTPPPVQGEDKTLLGQRFRGNAGETVELPADLYGCLKARADLKASNAKVEAEIDKIDAEIMAYMGDATEATYQGETVLTWRPQSRTSIDAKALKEAHPALAAEFSRTSSFRKFTPKELS
jgi:putative phage-type endonuclease